MSTPFDSIEIEVSSPRLLDEGIEGAVLQLQKVALLTGTHGILVTRVGPGRYTAELSDQVPFGITRELVS